MELKLFKILITEQKFFKTNTDIDIILIMCQTEKKTLKYHIKHILHNTTTIVCILISVKLKHLGSSVTKYLDI